MVFNWVGGARVFWVSVFDIFEVVVLSGGFFASGFHCVCARARGLAHLVYLQERKNILTNVKECREGKLIWHVSLF